MSNLNIPQLDQYTFTVGTTPGEAAGISGPFQVINGSTTATVWLADNSVVSDGHGIPLYPGTGMVWTGGQNTGQLWAVLGLDSASQTAGSAPIFIGSTVRDWQANPIAVAVAILNSGLVLVDNPKLLANLSLNSATTYQSAAIDVRGFQTLQIRVVRSSVPNHTFDLNFNWIDANNGNILGVDSYRWTATDFLNMQTAIPCRGGFVTVSVQTAPAAVNPDTVLLIGSNRPWQPFMSLGGLGHTSGLGTPDAYGNRVIASSTSNTLLATGNTGHVSFNYRYDGPAFLTVDTAGGATAQSIFGAVRDLVVSGYVGVYRDPGFVDTGTTRNEFTFKCVIPRNTCEVQLVNLSGANLNYNCVLVASLEG